jgi:peroxiredoxin
MHTQQMPYMWLNGLLGWGAVVLFCLSFGLLLWSFLSGRCSRKRLRVLSLVSFLSSVFLLGATYGLIFLVQLPSLRSAPPNAQESPGTLTSIGDDVPSFSVTTLDGRSVAFEDLKGKTVLINFFATWCGPCMHELPHLQEIWERYRTDDGFAMLVIGREEGPETVRTFVRERGFTFPAAADPHGEVYRRFAGQGIPRSYLIASNGTIRYQSVGFRATELPRLKHLIKTLLQ